MSPGEGSDVDEIGFRFKDAEEAAPAEEEKKARAEAKLTRKLLDWLLTYFQEVKKLVRAMDDESRVVANYSATAGCGFGSGVSDAVFDLVSTADYYFQIIDVIECYVGKLAPDLFEVYFLVYELEYTYEEARFKLLEYYRGAPKTKKTARGKKKRLAPPSVKTIQRKVDVIRSGLKRTLEDDGIPVFAIWNMKDRFGAKFPKEAKAEQKNLHNSRQSGTIRHPS